MSQQATTIEGIDRTILRLRAIGAEGERIASEEIVGSALDIQGHAKRLLTEQKAVDTGRLRNSVTVAPTESELRRLSDTATGGPEGSGAGTAAVTMVVPGMLDAWIGTNVHYAAQIHFGRRGMPARPYLFPAAEAERPKLFRRMGRHLKKLEAV